MNIENLPLTQAIASNWWMLLLRGLFAIAFGLCAWFLPGVSLAVLIIMFGAFSLADGVVGIWMAFSGRQQNDHWWVLLLWAISSLLVGLCALFAPGVTAVVLLWLIAAWSIIVGVLQIAAAIRLRQELQGEWRLVLSGALGVLFGVALFAWPGAGILTLLWLIGAFAVLIGVLLVILAFKVRSFKVSA
ncbi:HdeD family acid-resistance protein [Gilvimarinus sp. DA14]|uniref:HdeD family acid-resistance protein n=1 Tax=Gilvimarinus sp. DA14 TaxID=2956798 RepID=UPI0020B68A61|nr:HdeD family acid-resistance protein [Gilvimarinus sp. DA14]UTF61843.1 HdeD family acid-resistance protein [Gilvimarinus sp. DA14]